MIGHSLAFGPRPATRAAWDQAIAVGFAVGSACFFIGPFPGFVQLVGPGADGVVFFAGSVFFTLAAGLELREGTVRRGRRWGRDPSWWSAAIQFVGTLLFNLDTFDAMQTSLSSEQEDRLVSSPRTSSGRPASSCPVCSRTASRRARGCCTPRHATDRGGWRR